MPDISDEDLALERSVEGMRPMSEMVAQYDDPRQILDEIMKGKSNGQLLMKERFSLNATVIGTAL